MRYYLAILTIIAIHIIVFAYRVDKKGNDSVFVQYQQEKQHAVVNRQGDLLELHDCLKPLAQPILGTHDLSRILNMGMPKSGTSSLYDMFERSLGNKKANHFVVQSTALGMKREYCGLCMHRQFEKNDNNTSSVFEACGNYQMYAQMDYLGTVNKTGFCIFPQMEYMDRLYQESPNATWIMTFRNTTDWLRSVTRWAGMADRFKNLCGFDEFDRKNKNREEDVATFVCNHVKSVRRFVMDHPSLSLVEFDIYDENAGNYLADVFPILNASHWGQSNTYENEMKKEALRKVRVRASNTPTK